jgi:two-component system nitrate/nitrite response regulator NarL
MVCKDVAIISRNKLFRAGLARLLFETSFERVIEADDIEGLKSRIKDAQVPCMFLAEAGDDAEGTRNLVAALRTLDEQARVVVLAESPCREQLCSAFAAGADGFLLKEISYECLEKALHLALLGEKVFPSYLASMLVEGMNAQPRAFSITQGQASDHSLSAREVEILGCLAEGYSNKVIAKQLRIAEATVKVHVKSILRKIKAANRTEAAIWAVRHGVGGNGASEHYY